MSRSKADIAEEIDEEGGLISYIEMSGEVGEEFGELRTKIQKMYNLYTEIEEEIQNWLE